VGIHRWYGHIEFMTVLITYGEVQFFRQSSSARFGMFSTKLNPAILEMFSVDFRCQILYFLKINISSRSSSQASVLICAMSVFVSVSFGLVA